ncbi:carbon storage regulator [Pseudomonas helleri]|uniref:carbon storage regulator n=1 Tax=Pseudomonas helleri TaxID=1608996 RepID=UPI00065CCF02|nr:carbon storage regulator [Pseudomonas helleri]KMN08951.1 hypothetical protein TU84_15395 [Pseudomonas helleri]
MLTIARYIGESIIIGDNITIQIKGISGDRVKLSIDAPKSVTIHRYELFCRFKPTPSFQR